MALRSRLSLAGSILILVALGWLLYRGGGSAPPAEPAPGTAGAGTTADGGGPGGGAARDDEARRGAARKNGRPGQGDVRLYGRVVMAGDGGPAAGAAVYLGETIAAKADDSGEFAIDGLTAGEYRVFAERDGFLSFRSRRDVRRIVIAEEDQLVGPIELRLEPAALLRVRVSDFRDGKPVAGAVVKPVGLLSGHERTTDERGEALLRLSADPWVIQVLAPLYQKASKNVALDIDRETTVEVKLLPGGAIYGAVVDQLGQPVAGAQIALIGSYNDLQAESDARGRYRLDHAPLGRSLNMLVRMRGYWPAYSTVRLTPTRREARRDIILEARRRSPSEFEVEGVVLADSGEPIAGARLSCGSPESLGRRETRSDAEGRFTLEIVEEGWRDPEIWTEAEGYAPKSTALIGDVGEKPLVIVMQPGHWLAGRVVDRMDEPVPSVAITARDNVSGQRLRDGQPLANTDADGRFRLDSLPPAPRLVFTAPGYSTLERRDLPMDRDDVVVELADGGVVFGKAVDRESGRPITEFNIKIKSDMSLRIAGQSRAVVPETYKRLGVDFRSDTGEFRIEGLNAGGVCSVVASAPGYGELLVEETPIREEREAEPLVLEMEKSGRRVAGVVEDETGRPLAGVALYLLIGVARDRDFAQRVDWNFLDQADFDGPALAKRTALTDGQGRFLFEDVPEEHVLDLFLLGEGFARKTLFELEAKPAGELAALTVVLDPAARVFGSVNLEKLPEAYLVNIHGSMGQSSFFKGAYLSRGGGVAEFAFESLDAGQFTVRLLGSNDSNRHFEIEIVELGRLEAGEEREVNFGGEESHRLSGQILINGAPMSVGAVFLIKPEPGFQPGSPSVYTDRDGRFELLQVKEGVYELVAFSGRVSRRYTMMQLQGHPNRETVEVRGDVERVFRFTRVGNLRGRLQPPPTRHIQVTAAEVDGEGRGIASVDSDGSFLITKLAPGEYRLRAHAQGGSRTLLDSVIMPEDGRDVDLGDIDFDQDGGRLTVFLEGDDMALLKATAIVSFQNPGDGVKYVSKAFAGESMVEFEMLELGDVACRVIAPGYRTTPPKARFEISLDQPAVARFRLEPVTELELSVPSGGPTLARVAMTQAETGAVIQFESVDLSVFAELQQASHQGGRAVFSNKYAFFRGAPPGLWTIEAADAQERIWRQQVELLPGAKQSMVVAFR